MSLILLGVNYRTAPVSLREQLAIPSRELPQCLHDARTALDADEVAILSTCNRTEWYVVCDDPDATARRLLDWLSARRGLSPTQLQPACYRLVDDDAVAHLCRVTAGLDSMILGESEVTAQVKHAYATAQDAGTIGSLLHRLFQKALHCAKLVRASSAITTGHASVGSVVATLATERLGPRLQSCEVLLWGAGKAAEATARHLVAAGIGKLWIVNRTQAKAEELAGLCRGGWVSWEQALLRLAHVDLAIICTQAPHYVVDQADIAGLLPARRGRPLGLIDLAVPRNVDPAVRRQPGVWLYDIDDLDGIAQASLAARRQVVGACRELIDRQVEHFMQWRRSPLWKEVVACGAPIGSS